MYCDYLLLKGFMNVRGINVPFQVMVYLLLQFCHTLGRYGKITGWVQIEIKLEI